MDSLSPLDIVGMIALVFAILSLIILVIAWREPRYWEHPNGNIHPYPPEDNIPDGCK